MGTDPLEYGFHRKRNERTRTTMMPKTGRLGVIRTTWGYGNLVEWTYR